MLKHEGWYSITKYSQTKIRKYCPLVATSGFYKYVYLRLISV